MVQMTRDDIIRMAREAGMPPAEIVTDKPVVYPVPEAIERFAALVAAAERERKPRRNVTYVCPVCAASLERQE